MQSGGEKSTREHAQTATVIIANRPGMIVAGVAYAKQTTSSTAQITAPAQQTTQRDWPFSGETTSDVREGKVPARVQDVVHTTAAKTTKCAAAGTASYL